MPRRTAILGIALAAAALAVAGCRNSAQVFEDQNEGGWFAKKVDLFAKPDWARPAATNNVNLGPQGPVAPEDMVGADGRCVAPAAALAQTSETSAAKPGADADRPVGSVAGDLAGAPMPAAQASGESGMQRLDSPNSAPLVAGSVTLGMTECQAVQRAGTPNNVAISADEKGNRKVVLTYLSGPWPGIYTFTGGRLNVVDRAPEQPKPAKSTPKKKTPAKPKTASHEIQREFVQ